MRSLFVAVLFCLIYVSTASAHFGTVIPSTDVVSSGDPLTIGLEIKFIHPMELKYMEMARPREFGVVSRGKKYDLLSSLREAKWKGLDPKQNFTYWRGDFTVKRPGDLTFYVVPQPYWEPAEDLFIVHYTKVTVAALGLEGSGRWLGSAGRARNGDRPSDSTLRSLDGKPLLGTGPFEREAGAFCRGRG